MPRTAADQFANIFVAARVKRIYGIVGGSLNGLTDTLRRQRKIEWLHVRHEEVTAFAADTEIGDEVTIGHGAIVHSCRPRPMTLMRQEGEPSA